MTPCSLWQVVCNRFLWEVSWGLPEKKKIYAGGSNNAVSRSNICLLCWFVWAINRSPQLRLSAESICLDPFIQQPACLVWLLECLSECISIEPVSLCLNPVTTCLFCRQTVQHASSSNNVNTTLSVTHSLHAHLRSVCVCMCCGAAGCSLEAFTSLRKYQARVRNTSFGAETWTTHLQLTEAGAVLAAGRFALQINRKPSPHCEFSRAGIHNNDESFGPIP